jgi:hypothetical protein
VRRQRLRKTDERERERERERREERGEREREGGRGGEREGERVFLFRCHISMYVADFCCTL